MDFCGSRGVCRHEACGVCCRAVERCSSVCARLLYLRARLWFTFYVQTLRNAKGPACSTCGSREHGETSPDSRFWPTHTGRGRPAADGPPQQLSTPERAQTGAPSHPASGLPRRRAESASVRAGTAWQALVGGGRCGRKARDLKERPLDRGVDALLSGDRVDSAGPRLCAASDLLCARASNRASAAPLALRRRRPSRPTLQKSCAPMGKRSAATG